MKAIFDLVSYKCSELTTKKYSTSFSLGIKMLDKKLHDPIYAIYGFVRFADEIVDTFHDFDKHTLLADFKMQTYRAIKERISLNPILNSFQDTVNKYNIDHELIETFLQSMEMDLTDQKYDIDNFKKYILGSAEVVGLMCLKVFCNGEQCQYDQLKPSAMSLGSAFQKVNFLRDMKADYVHLGRAYFPGLDMATFDHATKLAIEKDIQKDFDDAYKGIVKLPESARLGVYLAYKYYLNLFKKIKSVQPSRILKERIRIANLQKYSILMGSYCKYRLKMV